MNEFRRTRNAMRTTGNLGQDALARWKAQGDITNFPMIRYQDKMENFRPSSFNMEDGSFLRLKNITLGYTLPHKWTRSFHVSKLRVYATGQNLFCLNNYSGYDPEVNIQKGLTPGIDNNVTPRSRVYTLGMNLNF